MKNIRNPIPATAARIKLEIRESFISTPSYRIRYNTAVCGRSLGMRDLSVRVVEDISLPRRSKNIPGSLMDHFMQVNKELWLILTVFLIAFIVNRVVSSQRLMLSFYTLPTLFSAYFFGRRHATMTAVFSVLVVASVA